MTIKVSVICNSDKTCEELTACASGLPDVVFHAYSAAASTLAGVLNRDQPDVLLLDFPITGEPEMAQLEATLLETPDTHLVLVSPDRSTDFLLRAMRAGAREVLPAPLNLASVEQAITHVNVRKSASATARAREPGQVGRVLAVVGAKGGAGGTFLATNLAFALSMQGQRVAVIDLNLYFGDAVIFLGDSIVKSNVVDVARKAQQIDRTLLESSMIKVSDRLHMLAAPESPTDINVISPSDIEKIIALARSCYDFVVLDVSPMLDALAVKGLDMADTIYLILQLNLPFVRAAKRMVASFHELGYPNKKISVIVNRHEKGGDVALADVENATQLEVARTIPNSHVAVTASINQGVPLLELVPHNLVAHALQEWAQELAPTNEPRAAHGGWLRGLRGHLS